MALGVYIYLYPELPKISDLDKAELQIPLKIYTSDGKLISEFGEIHRTKIIFEDIPEGLLMHILQLKTMNSSLIRVSILLLLLER